MELPNPVKRSLLAANTLPPLGSLSTVALETLLHEQLRCEWTGVIRLRWLGRVGALWLVRGNVVHAVTVEGQHGTRGPAAVEQMMSWANGSYFCQNGVLPPDRTIRMTAEELLVSLRSNAEADGGPPTLKGAERLDHLLHRLRAQFPEIVGIGVADDRGVRELSPCEKEEHQWIEDRVRLLMGDIDDSEILVRERARAVLLVKRNNRVAVVFGTGSASAEGMLWAGEETRRWILESQSDASGGVE